ncbi:MAG: hypothetical protein ABWY00_18215 [Dongiaceae bacterium]
MYGDVVDTKKLANASGSILASLDRPPRAVPQLALEPKEIDAGLYLFALCKYFQISRLKGQHLDCRMDGEGVGKLPEAVCRLLGLMVCELIAAGYVTGNAPQAIAVTLRKRGATCLCVVSSPGRTDQGLAGYDRNMAPALRRVRQLAAELSGGCLVRSIPDRGLTAIMVDIPSVEDGSPAIARHRMGEMRH